MPKPTYRIIFFLFVAIFSPLFLFASETAPEISVLSAALIDAKTGALLYEKNGETPHPPASLTKVVTIHLLLEEIESGRLAMEDEVPLPPESWASNLPRDSSLMFLGPDQSPRVLDILRGLAVSSGNDAAVAAAHLAAGSVDGFARRMNDEMRKLGLENLRFTEPSGYDEKNSITARDFARFLKLYLERHPDSLKTLHSMREFTYPRPENLKRGNGSTPITQYNRNILLSTYPGVDGFKTGYLHESGYNIALTAERDGMRLILVLLGAFPETPRVGGVSLARDAAALLDYGFAAFSTIPAGHPEPEPVRVWKGREKFIVPRGPSEIWVTVKKGEESSLRGELSQTRHVTAPVAAGASLGKVRIKSGQATLYEADLTAASPVARGPWYRILLDDAAIFFRKLFGYPV